MEKRNIKQFLTSKNATHRFIYGLCVFCMFVINFVRVNGTGGQWAFANELFWVIIFVMTMVREGIPLFRHKAVVFVLVFWLLLFYPFFTFYSTGTDYDLQLLGRYINILLGICLAIHSFHILKGKTSRLNVNLAFFVPWFIYLLFCFLSKNESFWPLYAAVFLGAFYFLPLKSDEKKALSYGIVDGIIASFCIFQGFALLFCHYDGIDGRYWSCFSSSDCSAKFFSACFIGFLWRYIQLRKESATRVKCLIALGIASSMFSFTFFTMTRSGFLGIGAGVIAFFVIERIYFSERFRVTIKLLIFFCVVSIAMIPVVFELIRYTPTILHHPVFVGEYSEDRVHSWDGAGSEKYVDLADVFQINGDRLSATEGINGDAIDDSNAMVDCISTIDVLSERGDEVIRYADGVIPGTDSMHPAYIVTIYDNAIERMVGVRKYIFKFYIEHSGLRGTDAEYPAYWVFKDWVYTSAHNTFLDISSRYGWPAALAYISLILSMILDSWLKIRKNRTGVDSGHVVLFVFLFTCIGWSLFYSIAFQGEILESLFWIMPVIIARRTEGSEVEQK